MKNCILFLTQHPASPSSSSSVYWEVVAINILPSTFLNRTSVKKFFLTLFYCCNWVAQKKATKISANNHESNSTRPPPKIHFEKVLSVSCFSRRKKNFGSLARKLSFPLQFSKELCSVSREELVCSININMMESMLVCRKKMLAVYAAASTATGCLGGKSPKTCSPQQSKRMGRDAARMHRMQDEKKIHV